MPDEEHRRKRQQHAHAAVGEEHRHPQLVHEEAGEYGRNRLRRHAGRVIKAGVLSDVAAARELHDHGIAVYVYRGPAHAREGEEDVHHQRRAARAYERAEQERAAEDDDAAQDLDIDMNDVVVDDSPEEEPLPEEELPAEDEGEEDDNSLRNSAVFGILN